MGPPACSLECVHEIGLSCGISPIQIATSAYSALIAVYGTVGDRACVLVASIASPASQVLVKLPRHINTSSKPISLEWSPAGVEEMLLVAWRDGNITVLSMTSPSRYGFCCRATLRSHSGNCPRKLSFIKNMIVLGASGGQWIA